MAGHSEKEMVGGHSEVQGGNVNYCKRGWARWSLQCRRRAPRAAMPSTRTPPLGHRTRRLPGSRWPGTPLTASSVPQISPEEEERRRVRRERNKLAAAKCRNRRKELTDFLQAVSIGGAQGARPRPTKPAEASPAVSPQGRRGRWRARPSERRTGRKH